MKFFSKIIFFVAMCLFVRDSFADPCVMIYENLDFGHVAVSDTSQDASFTLDMNSGNIIDIVRVSVSGQNRGLLGIHNDGSSQVRLRRVLTPKSSASTTASVNIGRTLHVMNSSVAALIQEIIPLQLTIKEETK